MPAKKLTTKEIIKRSKDKFGDRYEYSKTEYVNLETPIILICKKHGEFVQNVASHIAGNYGCIGCIEDNKKLKHKRKEQELLQTAKKKHGNKFDYSKVKYTGSRKKVTIGCPVHGDFINSMECHIKSTTGCPECTKENRRTPADEWIKKARKKHGDRYDYSKVVYTGGRAKKVIIICPDHGEFKQGRSCHLQGRGCPKCFNERHSSRRRLTQEDFIKRAKEEHGDKYDYSKTEYVMAKNKITIGCPIHGDFQIRAGAHITHKKRGCPKCSTQKMGLNNRHTTEDFIKKAKEIHGDRYDYSKAEYRHNKTKVEIICKQHGSFFQKPKHHISGGSGCPKCAKSHLISEDLFRRVLEKIFVDKFNKEYKFPNTHPKWLRNPETGWPLELDCYNEELELAFELHGRQHYEPIDFFGGEKAYIKRYRRDLRKKNICLQKGVSLFHIDARPATNRSANFKKQYYEQEILKCLAKVPEKIKVKLLDNKVPVQRQSETTIYNT